MIDINTILQQALATAIEQATKPLIERITALETQLNTTTLTPLTHEYIAKVAREAVTDLSTTINSPSSANATAPVLTEERVMEIARAAADEAIENHADAYNHDEYDRVTNMLDDYDLDDFVSESDLEKKVESAVRDLTFTVSVE